MDDFKQTTNLDWSSVHCDVELVFPGLPRYYLYRPSSVHIIYHLLWFTAAK